MGRCALATDLTGPLKSAIIGHLKGNAALTALVPAERIYPMAVPAKPAWPFIRYGSPITGGFEAQCWSGSASRVTLHAFAETAAAYAGEDRALEIAAAIVEAMKTFAPPTLGVVACEYQQTRYIMEDDEASRWHAIVEFNVTVVEAA